MILTTHGVRYVTDASLLPLTLAVVSLPSVRKGGEDIDFRGSIREDKAAHGRKGD